MNITEVPEFDDLSGPDIQSISRREDPIDGNSPPGHGWFRISVLTELEDSGLIGILPAVGTNHFRDGVDIPDDDCPGFEVIRAFRGEALFRHLATILPPISSAFPSTRERSSIVAAVSVRVPAIVRSSPDAWTRPRGDHVSHGSEQNDSIDR